MAAARTSGRTREAAQKVQRRRKRIETDLEL